MVAEEARVVPDQEISDGAGRIVAGRFHTLRDADAVMARLRGLDLGPQLQERSELPTTQARLWIWVMAEDLERARDCMRPGDVLGVRRDGGAANGDDESPGRKGILGRIRG
jgi:hypothetical protein